MLALYHNDMSLCAQKVRVCLAEKRLPWEDRHIVLRSGEHQKDWYVKLNRRAVVPTLIDGDKVIPESNVILEYLDEVFPDLPLRPAGAYERAMMRLWVYNSEEMAHWNVNVCSHNLRHAKRMEARYSREELLRAADQCSNPMIALRLKRRLHVGVSTEEESEAYAKLEFMLKQMEIKLADGPWLAGQSFSLADVAMAPMINRIEVLARPEMIEAARRPRVADWWQRIQARPGFQEAFAFKNPDQSDPVKR